MSNTFIVNILETREQYQNAADTVNEWDLIIQERVCADVPLSQEQQQQDADITLDYESLLWYYRGHCERRAQKINDYFPHICLTVSDVATRTIQAMGMLETAAACASKEMEVEYLFTAPWRLALHAPLPERYQERVVRGAATAVLRAAYEIAQASGKEQLGLSSYPLAASYYQHVGMLQTEDFVLPHFVYPIQAELPDALRRTQLIWDRTIHP